MAIEDIFRALDEQADVECEQILHGARTQGEAIISEVQAEASRILDQKIKAAEDASRRTTAQMVNAARIENMKCIGTVREQAIAQVYSDAADRLTHVREQPAYTDIFRALSAEALATTEGECVLMVDPADKALASQLDGVIVQTEIQTAGGAVVTLDGGRITRRNTFESRLNKLQGFAGASVAEILQR